MKTQKDIFLEEGFTIEENKNESPPLLEYIREHHPDIIRDNEIDLQALKSVLGLPIDNKVNGYGLNFIGRNVGRAQYARETDQELKVNSKLSVDFDHTQNMVLKGDNLDTLKILKSHYNGKIKCIYIDPPYNTARDEFVYPDRWDKEEQEVLGLAHLTPEDMERMEFSFKTKKSHNGWLTFMYPRLLLARDLLTRDGVIFISIDDNEQANLKLLCDEIFGEENFVALLPTIMNLKGNNDEFGFSGTHEYNLVYCRNKNSIEDLNGIPLDIDEKKSYSLKDEKGNYKQGATLMRTGESGSKHHRPKGYYPIYVAKDLSRLSIMRLKEDDHKVYPKTLSGKKMSWRRSPQNLSKTSSEFIIKKTNNRISFYKKQRLSADVKKGKKAKSLFYKPEYSSGNGTLQLKKLLKDRIFDNPKPLELIKDIIHIGSNPNDLILDFFAGSGTTGHAVMQLNAEDGGNRRFILCQIDEPIQEDQPAFQFCKDQGLDPVISSITIERLRRAGEKIRSEIKENHQKTDLFEENKKSMPDLGFKVFDTVSAPTLELVDGKIHFHNMDNDPLSRIYNMIFSVGIDPPTAPLECIKEDCIYRIGKHYYITRSKEVTHDELSQAIKSGKVFIDGWTATINATLQHFKEDVKIVF